MERNSISGSKRLREDGGLFAGKFHALGEVGGGEEGESERVSVRNDGWMMAVVRWLLVVLVLAVVPVVPCGSASRVRGESS